MEDITEKLAQLEEAAKKLPQKGILSLTQREVDAEEELRQGHREDRVRIE